MGNLRVPVGLRCRRGPSWTLRRFQKKQSGVETRRGWGNGGPS